MFPSSLLSSGDTPTHNEAKSGRGDEAKSWLVVDCECTCVAVSSTCHGYPIAGVTSYPTYGELSIIITGWFVMLIALQFCVHGDYVIIARVHSYTNPSNTGVFRVSRGASNCCDGTRQNGVCSGWRKCDNRFTFCVKTLGDLADGTSSCMSEVLMSTETNVDDAPIDFTGSTWLGLDNPLRLNGISTPWQVCLCNEYGMLIVVYFVP